MEWLVSALKYAPEIMAAGQAAGQAVENLINGNQSAEATADLFKPLVMIGVKILAENKCESSPEAGVTTALGSAGYDVAVSALTGKEYGMVKDCNNGDYTVAASKSMQDFASGFQAHFLKNSPIEQHRKPSRTNRKKRSKRKPSIAEDESKTTVESGIESIGEMLYRIGEAYPDERTVAARPIWEY